MHEQEKQIQERCDVPNQWILNRVKWIIAQKNTLFILEHQNDTLEQLSVYLQTCMESIGHPPARVEVIGGDLLALRFGSWEKALNDSGYLNSIGHAVSAFPLERTAIFQAEYEHLHAKR